MVSISLPVMTLSDEFIFPNSELKLEISDPKSVKSLALAKDYHNNYILAINKISGSDSWPEMGVVCQIKNMITMPSRAIKVTLIGRKRVTIHEYHNEKELFEAEVSKIKQIVIEESINGAYLRKISSLYKLLSSKAPYLSNELTDYLSSNDNLHQITDALAASLPFSNALKLDLIKELDPVNRADIIIKQMKQEIDLLEIDQDIEEKLQVKINESQKEFILKEKINIIKSELGENNHFLETIRGLRQRLNQNYPDYVKKRLTDEIDRLEIMTPASLEYGITYSYITTILDLPWFQSSKGETNIEIIQKQLELTHFGLYKAKERIIEHIAAINQKASLKSPILCLVGPPGTGKTSLAESIAASLKRQFVKMSVGGLADEAEIIGHRKTYVGANPGKIMTSLKKVGVNNPVFLIDEIDKLSHNYKGDPASALLDVLDHNQNHQFNDLYIDMPFDLSHIMFITTANDLNQIPVALRDRLEIIELPAYYLHEKVIIAKQYLIPSFINNYHLKNKITFTDDVIKEIINEYTYEPGIRKLASLIDQIMRKALIANKKVNITHRNLSRFLDATSYHNIYHHFGARSGLANMLVVNDYLGFCLPVEVLLMPGNGQIILTGSIGIGIKESIMVMLSYLKKNASIYKIDVNKFNNCDIHIHATNISVKKDGASGGVAICLALYSALTNTKLPSDIASTGEITLHGHILPVSGLALKLTACIKENIKKVFIPAANKKNVMQLPMEITSQLEIIYVENMKQVINQLELWYN